MSSPITHVVKRNGAVVPFNRERITNAIYRAAVAVGGRDRAVAENLADQVTAILEGSCAAENRVPTVEEIQDIVEKVLIENGHARTAKAYILYRQERAMRRRRRQGGETQRDSENIPYRKLWEVLNWAIDHNVHNIFRLNERIAKGEFADIVRESDAAYEQDVEQAARLILDRRGEVHIAIIAGPSSSGKTTTTAKLGAYLKEAGLNLVALNVDNYFFDLDMHPKDEYGDYDFETPQALDLALINDHLQRLIAGEAVAIPYYNFKTGMREGSREIMKIGPDDIILIDSLHGLYAGMTQSIPDEQKFRLYIETLLQMKGPDNKYIRFTDLRLMRRMMRDARERAYDPRRTLEHWHYVRSSELRHIIPYANSADYVINGATPYELPIMRARLCTYFAGWVEQYKDDPNRVDAYLRAERVHNLLQTIIPVDNDADIPATSHVREFIGGSAYELH
ncbi:MAG TPA: ATP cone domain-containing protein [Anaerolineae bacterium]|nr:ATP cone domain-containing protein [Anaerolineae bacterium]HQH39449.1 ATP cone domain-containing protein [Anaerolineae bacterium]